MSSNTATRVLNVRTTVLSNGRVFAEREEQQRRNRYTSEYRGPEFAAILEELGHPDEPVKPARLAAFLGITYAAARGRLRTLGLSR